MAVNTIIMAILFVVILGGSFLFLTRGTANANVLSLLSCNPFGGEGCEQAGARTVESTGFVEDAIRCAYLRCLKGCNDPDISFIGTNGWCKKYFCSDTTRMDKTDKGRICDENAEAYPVQPSKTAKGAKLRETLSLTHSNEKQVRLCINPISSHMSSSKMRDNCDFKDFNYDDISKTSPYIKDVYENYVVLEIPPKYLSDPKGENCGSVTAVAEATVDVDKISVWAVHASKNNIRDESYRDTGERLVSLRVCKSVQGPVTLFKNEKFGVPFLDISDKRADLGDLNNKVSSVKLESNWGVTMYDNKEYKGDCRTFFSSVEKLKDFGFVGSAESVKVWKDGFKGVILYDHPRKKDGTFDNTENSEYYPNDGATYSIKKSGCVGTAKALDSKDSLVVLYDASNKIILRPTSFTGELDKAIAEQVSFIKVCPNVPSSNCLTDEEKKLI